MRTSLPPSHRTPTRPVTDRWAFKPVALLLLVPVIYTIFVLDLKLIKWDAEGEAEKIVAEAPALGAAAPAAGD